MLAFLPKVHSCPLARVLALLLLLPLGCDGSTVGAAGQGGGGDGGDGGASGASGAGGGPFKPAKHSAPPQVVSSGGPVLLFPRVKAIYYADEPETNAKLEAFMPKLAESSLWSRLSEEYGFGPLTIGKSVHRSINGPETLTEAMMLTELSEELQAQSPDWGSPSSNTIYTFVIPSGTKFLGGGLCCVDFAGYHAETAVGTTKIPFAVVCGCPGAFPGLDDIDQLTVSLTHEIMEAAANPYVGTDPAFEQTDEDHAAWTYLTNGEAADLCQFEKNVLTRPADIGFGVPRIWSNKAALAGNDPCIPAPAEPYFNSAPDFEDEVTIHFFNRDWHTLGVKIPEGKTGTIDVRLFSDAPTPPWTLEAFASASGLLSFSWDEQTGQNGDVRKLTIKALKATPGNQGVPFYIKSTLGGTSHLWMGVVAN